MLRSFAWCRLVFEVAVVGWLSLMLHRVNLGILAWLVTYILKIGYGECMQGFQSHKFFLKI